MTLSERSKSTVATADVPTTTKDMTKMFEWEYGDTLYGTRAKNHSGEREYRKDINKSYGKEDSYKDFYVDTLKPVGEQLKKK